MKQVKQNKNGSDEYYTPAYVVNHILKYLKPNSKIWCPFDLYDSNFVKVLSNNGHNVIYTHINNNGDFFKRDYSKWADYIISNPPFSLKGEVIKRLYKMGTPFIMLLPLAAIETQKRHSYFMKYGIELLIFDHRIIYINGDSVPNFNSSFYCWKVLPRQLILEPLDKEERDKIKYENKKFYKNA